MGLHKYSVVESGNVGLGQAGSAVLDNAEAISNLATNDVVIAITLLEDTTFTTLTQSSAAITGTGTSTYGNSIATTDVFPAGVTIYGNWSAVTALVGLCICYIG